jgi:two-component system OmpR family sensor kinase
MKVRTLRGRAALAAAVAIIAAVVILGTAIEVLAARQLHSALDRTLRARAAEIARLSATAPALLVTPAGVLETPLGGQQLSVEIVDKRGRIVARSLGLGGRVLPAAGLIAAATSHGTTAYADGRIGTEPVRMYVAPLADIGGAAAAGGAVVIAAATGTIQENLHRIRLFVILGGIGAAVAAAAAVWLLMARALRPLDELSRVAGEIEASGDSRRRFPESASAEEARRLGVTLNEMLGALERARERERQFIADASHELRTPLTALRGNAAYVARHGADRETLDDLALDAERVSRLVDDLLALSREDAATAPRELVRLDDLARDAAASDVDVDVPGPIEVRGDRAALERTLTNLVENARRYGPAGGRIRVSARADGDVARLAVEDEGSGLAETDVQHAFERFWRGRTARDTRGSGLGLAIVAATATRHGGRVVVDGSRFTIELPLLKNLSKSAGTTDGDSF